MKFLLLFIFPFFIPWISGILEDSNQKCGLPILGGKIVGGVDVGGYHYPWFALLLLKDHMATTATLPVPVCAGSLITSVHVLTAAHCMTISSSASAKNLYNVAFGVYNICSDKEKTREIFSVSDVAIHEFYKTSEKFHDIALLKLSRRAPFATVCLPLFGVPDLTELALVVGFGSTSQNSNSVPCTMLEVNVTKFSRKDCLKTDLPKKDKTEPSVLCAGSFSGGVDSCYGDSGGPLLTKSKDGRYIIAGIVSYGYGCGNPKVPGIYTNVGSYLSWIGKKISELGYSEKPKINLSKENKNIFFPTRRQPEIQGNKVVFPKNNTKYFNKNQSNVRFSVGQKQLGKTFLNSSATIPPITYQSTRFSITPKDSQIYFPENN